MEGHMHTYPVDNSLSEDEAWDEICIMGFRTTYTGGETWATRKCDGEECRSIKENLE